MNHAGFVNSNTTGGLDRAFCPTCGEETIHSHGRCIHCHTPRQPLVLRSLDELTRKRIERERARREAQAARPADSRETNAPHRPPVEFQTSGESCMPTTKQCDLCRKKKPLDSKHFRRAPRSADGFSHTCLECRLGSNPDNPLQITPVERADGGAGGDPGAGAPVPPTAPIAKAWEEHRLRRSIAILEFEDGMRIGQMEVSPSGIVQLTTYLDLTSAQMDEICARWQKRRAAA